MKAEKFEKYKKCVREIFGKKYHIPEQDLPNTVKDKFTVICAEHGPFVTTFDSLLNKKSGCPSCSKRKVPTNEEFVARCEEIHCGKNYDFSETKYSGSGKKVVVICHNKGLTGEEHGRFEIRASHLLNGVGCPKCSGRIVSREEWIAKAKAVHGDKYDYTNVVYTPGRRNKVEIVCHKKDENGDEHGPFVQDAVSHLGGCGCPKCCGGVFIGKEHFIEKAKAVHGGKYSYDNVEYVNARTPVEIICKRHGSFMQVPYSHLAGRGCPRCNSSRLEAILMNAFEKNEIKYEYQVKLKGLGKKTIDFFVPEYNVYIECQGEQHFKDTSFGAEKASYKERVRLDKEKYDVVTKSGARMLYYYDESGFHKTDDEPDYNFYRDKKLFDNTNDLISEIMVSKKVVMSNNSNIACFYDDLLTIDSSVTKSGNSFFVGGIKIFFNLIKENESTTMSERRKFHSTRGYNIIEIFEDEYVEHKEIVLSKIRHLLHKDKNLEKVGARKCEVKTISKDDAEKFLNTYHIQGFASSTIYVGCFYGERMIAVMTFLKEDDKKWNLNRFATDISFVCQGVAGKMFKWFVVNYNPTEVKSFADRRWTFDKDDNLYTKIGFSYDSRLSSDYRYFKPGFIKRHHKFGFRKAKLSKTYGFPMTMTETEMTKKAGFKKIYDGGLFKYVWKSLGD